ncbi:MAG: TIGR03905 family TSCPD domain-containing protein [Evtepia sp.]|nr:TIGR03905 family TSCPD domain-containing protein [Evtepia sp.]
MTIQYQTKGVCSRQMNVKLEKGVVQKVEIIGGCAGNSQGVSRLIEGMKAEDAIRKIEGIRCGFKATSCPDQLSKALRIALAEEAKRTEG